MTMKNATTVAGPYELCRWKSSRGRLVVRTTWVKGVRHVILSDDDEKEKRLSSSPSSVREKNATRTTMSAKRQPLSIVRTNDNYCVPQQLSTCENNDDRYYVERVLQWLQKPSTMLLETQRKSVSAPGNGNSDRACSRRPALVKTCSIPDNYNESNGDQQVLKITKSSTKSVRTNNNNHYTQSRHKIELHVHIPSTGSSSGDNNYY